MTVPPVIVLSTGRCGSTMVSNILNRHPRILSLSEFFSFVGTGSFRRRRQTGDRMWELYACQQKRTRLMLREPFDELIYPFDHPCARYTRQDVPPILCATLPHLTEGHEELFDALEPVVRHQPRQPPAEHFRHLFEHLCRRFECSTWVERSGGSLLFGSRLLRKFPEARVIHVFRDGRETAISMSRHYLFRMIVANMKVMRKLGIDSMNMMARGKRWEGISLWLEPLASTFFDPSRVPYDQVSLAELGSFWSAMIERSEQILARFPPDRLLNVRFEDMQAEPEGQIRRLIRFIAPNLEDEAWLREASAIPRATPSKFAKLEFNDQVALAEACRPGLERLGYPL